MAWLKGKAAPRPLAASELAHHKGPQVARETQERITNLLISHQRVELHNGHSQMHFIGMTHNHIDGSIDYAVRSRVHGRDGKMERFDSHVRIYASGHLKLIR